MHFPTVGTDGAYGMVRAEGHCLTGAQRYGFSRLFVFPKESAFLGSIAGIREVTTSHGRDGWVLVDWFGISTSDGPTEIPACVASDLICFGARRGA